MKKIIFILSFILSACFSSYSQFANVVNLCAFVDERPAVMAFLIPEEKCDSIDFSLKEYQHKTNWSFKVNGELIKEFSFQVGSSIFTEVTYRNTECGEVAILIFLKKDYPPIISQPYQTNDLMPEFRILKKGEEFILFRKIYMENKQVTASFEFDMEKKKIDLFADDGLSHW